ncbi:MAG: hypothetical protein M1820_004210 [Bogoriella megaspora]|nr:MAG: hypothetical protein M1820_004210 [Bogoriella megaspora]
MPTTKKTPKTIKISSAPIQTKKMFKTGKTTAVAIQAAGEYIVQRDEKYSKFSLAASGKI